MKKFHIIIVIIIIERKKFHIEVLFIYLERKYWEEIENV